jgi:di/tricarboxylate transporter
MTMIVAGAIVVATLVVMTTGVVNPVLALASALVIAGILRIAPSSQLYSGLSNPGVITVGAMLVVAKGVVQTGVVSRVTRNLLATVTSSSGALRRLAAPVGVASAVMNTTPIVAMLIPASKQLEQTKEIPAREVMLPIAHITTLVGSVTLIGTSSNLLIGGIAAQNGVQMGMVSFAWVALPVALVGAVTIILIGPRLLRASTATRASVLNWRVEIPVGEKAVAAGRTAGQIQLATAREYELAAIRRQGEDADLAGPIAAGDRLVFRASESGVRLLWTSPMFGLAAQRLYAVSVGVGEQGTLNDLEDEGEITVVAAQSPTSLRRTPMLPGGTVYVTAADVDVIERHAAIAMWQDAASRVPQPGKTWIAVAILVGVIATATLKLIPIELGSVAGAILMVLTGVLTPRSAARALDWNILFVLAGSVGLGAIVLSSGLADQLASAIRTVSGGNSLVVILVLALVTTVLTNLVTNAAAASILTPVAITLSTELGVNPVIALALIGTCISFTFINPFSHQTNMMVMGPIGYTTKEFIRFGIPLLVICLVVASVAAEVLK